MAAYTIGPHSLRTVCPTLSARRADQLARELGDAMHRIGIRDPQTAAHFISQCAHESGEFRFTRELWGPTSAQRGYWRRRDLQGRGALWPGLGYATRGAGWIQSTGRLNFKAAAAWLGISYPRLLARASSSRYAALMAAAWWRRAFPHGADAMSVRQVTRVVNGGTNGLAERERYHHRAASVARFLVPREIP